MAPWDGFYAGGHLAYVWGRSRYRLYPADPVAGGATSLIGNDREFGPLLGGLQAGFNQTVPGGWLVGVEADVSFPDRLKEERLEVGGSGGADTISSVRSYGTLRGRIGKAEGNWLFYATGGLAVAREADVRNQIVGSSYAGITNPGDIDTASFWRFGYSAGGGVEVRLTPEWSARADYVFDNFGRRNAAFRLAQQQIASTLTIHNLRFGLNYHFDQKPVEDGGARGVLPNLDMFSIHGQTTQIAQGNAPLRARYTGTNSYNPGGELRESVSITGSLGFRPWIGTEFYFNAEPLQGFGLRNSHGSAGLPNGDAPKVGTDYPRYNTARLFVRQTFGLGGEQEKTVDGANQFDGSVDVSRVTITAGKFAILDLFDNNLYAHDQRVGFLNSAIWDGGTFDYASDTKGYTYGAALELNQKDWAARVGYFLEPSSPNVDLFDTRIARRGQYVGELEGRYSIAGQPGILRVLGWTMRAYSGSFDLVNTNPAFNGDITQTRTGRPASGFIVNLQQAVTDDLGIFGRFSWRDGHNEIVSFNDIDRSLSFGGVLKGTMWGRDKDTFGAAMATNVLRDPYRFYLANGGLGANIGDGALTYRRERILETYYSINLNDFSKLTFDYQFIANPGYNADRGPVSILAARLHTEF